MPRVDTGFLLVTGLVTVVSSTIGALVAIVSFNLGEAETVMVGGGITGVVASFAFSIGRRTATRSKGGRRVTAMTPRTVDEQGMPGGHH